MATDPLATFSPATRAWFSASFAAPTAAQAGAWESVAGGNHTLVVAPTGSGKTLAAFLWAVDGLLTGPEPDPARRCRVLYVSPLKALAADVQRNLRSPLVGIRHAAARLGEPVREVHVAMRTGDTAAEERRSLARRPPDILVTTPESLGLLLTSRARESLRGITAVVVDEVHALCTTKRGVDLALSLERLDALLPRPAQRIGLSATVRPVAEVATFLGGAAPVAVVAPPTPKQVTVEVVVPVPDMTQPDLPGTDLPTASGGPELAATPTTPSLWPAVEDRILDLVLAHRSTIVFANSRRLAERLCSRLNERAHERALVTASREGRDQTEVPVTVVARAHHGSVSREERAAIEDALKAGRLPAVVATSSLELGIDMGAVDLVVQVEAPPSVASGLQRIGRAGHQVGAASRGVLFPKHRGDLVGCAVVASRMADGAIEHMRYPRNALDVLAQHVVAMVAMEPWQVADVGALVRRAAPYAALPDSALVSVLDMLSGRYPSDAFAELRPRLVWDRASDTLTARPGAQRLAVTNGGTIPDRGLFGVYLAAGADDAAAAARGGGRRVGELDEEMVYESRVGDVFLLGTSAWRITEITPDRVLVAPAPGEPGKMPFWRGDAPGRPLELGLAIGRFLRETGADDTPAARARLREAGLDGWAADNLLAYLAEQRAATGVVPDDRTVVVERVRDELGDWRLAVHCPFGAQVTAPWALLVAARLRTELGVEVQAAHSDDGIVVRLPDMPDPPGVEALLFDPDDVERLVAAELGGSTMFAARFRECAGRSLLLPRRDPRRRAPLWQQRQRAATLLAVASRHPTFPVVLEAMRECLQDVFDVAGLAAVMRAVEQRRTRVVTVETQQPSPFARSLLFGYVGLFLYEGDAPLAERRAQALAVDTAVLAELLGTTELRDLLDETAIAEVAAELQRTPPHLHPRDAEGAADLLRRVGDLTAAEAAARGVPEEWLTTLVAARRAIVVTLAGTPRYLPVEDAGRVRDGLGAALPPGIAFAFLEPVADPLGDLVARYARTHGPFTAEECAHRLGLGVAVVTATLRTLATTGRVASGAYRPSGTGTEWIDPAVLRRIRRRSLARLRSEVEPVPPAALGRFLPAWQHVGGAALRGTDGLLRVVDQLQGTAVPASALEPLVLGSRVRDYRGEMLDELCAAGEVQWVGAGPLPGHDGWVALAPAGPDAVVPDPEAGDLGPLHALLLEVLADGGAAFLRTLVDRCAPATATGPDTAAVLAAVWDLVWAGLVTNDTLAPVRALLGGPTGRTRAAWQRRRAARPVAARQLGARPVPPTGVGRWTLVERAAPAAGGEAAARRARAKALALLDRHGVVTRGSVASATGERLVGGFGTVYPILRALEDAGHCRRGYFVEGLGAAQFAAAAAADLLRSARDDGDPGPSGALVLAATDPANPYGAALPWPDRPSAADGTTGHRPGRKAGALVVLVAGALSLYVERGGRSLLTWSDDPAVLDPAARALADAVRAGALGTLAVDRADGQTVHAGGPVAAALAGAGFRPTPRGLRLRQGA